MSVLEVHDVSIRYMTGDFKDIGLKEYVMRKFTGNYHVVEFWADHHITFSLEKGDMLGIIGTNGAGKSTLLKAISGIMEPTGGYVKREGNIAALLELASGFDGDLTVRENTYLRGAMLGYTRKFMDEKYPEIISFAELQDFQDRPFKQLSSGMMSRLAFSVASLVHPDILILDEVLSVGDGAFRKKSEAKMREIINSGATTILVSHAIEQVREMCNKVLWIEKGNQIGFGSTELLCDLYQRYLDGAVTLEDAKARLKAVDSAPAAEAAGGSCTAGSPDPELRQEAPSEGMPEPSEPWPECGTKTPVRPERVFFIDLAKAAAIGAAVLIHCSANHYARFEVGSLSWLITNLFGTVSRWAVPLFLLCSGAVMNDPDKSVPLKKLFSKYLLRLFLILAVSSVLYEIVGVLKAWGARPLTELLTEAGRNLLYGNTHYHLYFFWFIFALYLALPLTRLVTRFASEQELRYILLAFFLCGAVLPLLQYYSPVSQMHNSLLYFVLPAAFFCPGLGLMGWYMKSRPAGHWLGSLLLFLGGLMGTFGGTWLRSYRSGSLDGVYLGGFSPFVVIMAIAVFRMCQSFAGHARPHTRRVAGFLSSASFVIYLIHPFFQETLAPAWFLSQPVYMSVPLQWVLLMGLGSLTYLLIHRSSRVRLK